MTAAGSRVRAGASLAGIGTLLVASLLLTVLHVSGARIPARAAIPTTPDLTAAQLASPAGANWLTNGGSVSNDRYSSLGQVRAGNAAHLRGVWMTRLRGSGDGPQYSGESQPLEDDGVIYISTGADDVFAVSVATGRILWQYRAHIDPRVSPFVCCGWDNRGVAIGDGLVFLGRLDDQVVALDQDTGRVVWHTRLANWRTGPTITAAPLFMDGRIYIGIVGAEYGVRSFLTALDARTGRTIWRFYTTPAPHAPGGNTWPRNGSYRHGGASIWSTPAYDPRTGILYFSTGNAGPDFYGGGRRGKNLFTSSIVAVHASTGRLAGWFQEVHHDIWDYDVPSPVVLFTARVRGRSVRGIAHPTKMGWLFLVGRADRHGRARSLQPLYHSVREEPVPQNAAQRSWPTQPIPRHCCAFTPHGPVPARVVRYFLRSRTPAMKLVPYRVSRRMYAPTALDTMTIYAPD
ncbi:MAG: PQQ-binding-like beta-propeller repeat protein, partial [Solirubrobacteraceae bacterium]